MVISVKQINQNNHVYFMTPTFSQMNILLVNVYTLVKLNLLENCDFL
jgi:hypothetical protein